LNLKYIYIYNPILDNYFEVKNKLDVEMYAYVCEKFRKSSRRGFRKRRTYRCSKVDLNNRNIRAVNKQYKNKIFLKRAFGCYSLDVIASCCFGVDTNSIKDQENDFIRNMKIILSNTLETNPKFLLIGKNTKINHLF
jgi:hypothetical protein